MGAGNEQVDEDQQAGAAQEEADDPEPEEAQEQLTTQVLLDQDNADFEEGEYVDENEEA